MKMELCDILKADSIFLDVNVRTRTEVFDYFSRILLDLQFIDHEKEFRDGLLAREEQISTAIGYKIAVPHIQAACIRAPVICFLRNEKGILWEDRENSFVKMVFLIAVPQEMEGEHLNLLAHLSRKLMHQRIRKALMNMHAKEEIFQILGS
ncbi:PTS sugar transporter subunit IIA [Paenactinomyces guangxiensis]|uniref:PTS sugar transporter subunit IIA n=1 Tax=Paenactinomyces guangxiensis TaxID=1490290 RepID=A0A7W1WTC1_9BACL|nr:fructose PTS transporter subunit IIA [Paenactinomyces guangxiensis]MBA4495628.1 PTS sugar transporter subunit IIA [Paenactinomyces guangxiensis]MBH8592616.1 PTS sugar transporter subunit IIA [Paenactinomyces guangxiensis]